jgi:hypothetical protein
LSDFRLAAQTRRHCSLAPISDEEFQGVRHPLCEKSGSLVDRPDAVSNARVATSENQEIEHCGSHRFGHNPLRNEELYTRNTSNSQIVKFLPGLIKEAGAEKANRGQ